MRDSICPVPRDQQPIQEFIALKDSWFFSWAIQNPLTFYKKLFWSWLLFIPIPLIILSSDYTETRNMLLLCWLSSKISLLAPLLLILRQYLSWRYIYGRLVSERVIYEETGWYDAQIWEKPKEQRDKENIIGTLEVAPILQMLSDLLKFSLVIIGVALSNHIFSISL